MSRILIFDSQPRYSTQTDNETENPTQALGEATDALNARRSAPVRCFTGDGEQRIVGIEWLLDLFGEEVFAFRWWPEYFNDKASLAQPPTARDWKDVNAAHPWGRAMVANDAGGGSVALNPLTYNMNMSNRLNSSPSGDCLYVPLSVHALWLRVAVWCDLTASTSVGIDQLAAVRLRAYAIVGGTSEQAYLEENGDRLYAYNAFKS